MTLSTNIYILDEVDPHEVFNYCNSNLLKASDPRTEDKNDKWSEDGVMTLMNLPGQGLPAWLISHYREDGSPLYSEDQYDDDGSEEPYLMHPACYMYLDFDTAYGYSDEYGGCSTLHARYIVDLFNMLREKGVRIKWQNEFTGEYFDGIDGLEEFFEGGDKARAWMRSVLPAVLLEALDKGESIN